ncbi:MAG: glycerophosphodiester phosphodiesterase [Anaerolineae bacterium]|jgi:glycerophosphoryl diester phosphodiesterase
MAQTSSQARPLIIAHRGFSAEAPENTLAAFDAAARAGADGVELDVTMCASGDVVVIHDDTIDRTTNGSGRVRDMSLETLRMFDAGRWFDASYEGQFIPTLGDVLDLIGETMMVNIEIKASTNKDEGIEDGVIALVHQRRMQDRVLISSFSPIALWRMRRRAPELERALLTAPKLPFLLGTGWPAGLVRAHALHPHHSQVDADYVERAHAKGRAVNVWTVDEPAEMRRLCRLGIDGIITNHPARLRAVLEQLAEEGGTP